MANRPDEYYRSLVTELSKLTDETEWVEFKVGNDQPERIAKYISALSNSAALCGKPTAYLFWGIDDSTHEIVGAPFSYRSLRKGNEELEAWLARMVNPKLNLSFHDVDMGDGTNVVILEVPAATHEPTRYGPSAYVRVGSNVKSLANFKDREAQLWRTFDSTPTELRTVADGLSEEELFGLLDYPGYYRSLGLPIPAHRNQALADLAKEKFIAPEDAGTWSVTALGALMIAYDLGAFDGLARRVIRVVKYKGDMRLEDGGDREESFPAGYAISYEEIARYIMAITPSQEVLDSSIRRQHTAFPEIAVRELLANMMVHQSLDQRGTNPMVEVFSNRIEFSNPGAPLVPIERLIDTVPLSRNENMAGFMRKCGVCEERGSGYDKIVMATCENELIAPIVQNQMDLFTKAVLFAKMPFDLTSKEDRVRTCYMQACLAYVNFGSITNTDVRRVFGLEASKSSQASKIIRDAVAAGLVKPVDPSTAPRHMRYVPYWA